jgi:hypothetical protein
VSRRWMRLLVPAVAVVVAGVSVVLVAATFARQRAVPGWVATQNLPAGTAITAQDVREISVATTGDSFSLMGGSPVGERTTHAVSAGDLIRSDDVSSDPTVEVPVTLKQAPPLAAGSTIDVYAIPLQDSAASGPTPVPQGGATVTAAPVLIARGVVVADPGPPVVIEVPAQEEPLWVALASSQTELMGTLSSGADVSASSAGYQPQQAISILNGLAQGQGGSSSVVTSPTSDPSGGR